MVECLTLQQQQQHQQHVRAVFSMLYAPEDGETGLSIKASKDKEFVILTSSLDVGCRGGSDDFVVAVLSNARRRLLSAFTSRLTHVGPKVGEAL